MITIKEIASKLGLSTTTVSNVIHGKTKEVSADTIERVQKFLEEVEYVPNINARNLAQGQSKIIGVVLKSLEFRLWHSDNILSDPFVSEMIGGIEKAVREAGYYMMLYISDDIAEIIQHISIWNVDGLILFCMMDDDANRVAAKYHKPMVCIDTYSTEKSDDFINVGLDDEQGVAILLGQCCGMDGQQIQGHHSHPLCRQLGAGGLVAAVAVQVPHADDAGKIHVFLAAHRQDDQEWRVVAHAGFGVFKPVAAAHPFHTLFLT